MGGAKNQFTAVMAPILAPPRVPGETQAGRPWAYEPMGKAAPLTPNPGTGPVV
jgi:hypothetical protein